MIIRVLNVSRENYDVKNRYSILEEFKTIHNTLAGKKEFEDLYNEVRCRKEENKIMIMPKRLL